jgi:hypothetical protein
MTDPGETALLADRCQAVLGDPEQWHTPTGYSEGLGLCVLDAVWSIGVRYRSVENVLTAYRQLRRNELANPETDNPADLTATISAIGGAQGFSDQLNNHQRTSTRGGILKSQAVFDAAQTLTQHGLANPADLRSATNQRLDDVERDWRAVHGQRSGISWRYLLLLAGRQEVKPDRMIVRFVADAIDRQPSTAEAAALVAAVSATGRVDADLRTLDHRIWSLQSGRG